MPSFSFSSNPIFLLGSLSNNNNNNSMAYGTMRFNVAFTGALE